MYVCLCVRTKTFELNDLYGTLVHLDHICVKFKSHSQSFVVTGGNMNSAASEMANHGIHALVRAENK